MVLVKASEKLSHRSLSSFLLFEPHEILESSADLNGKFFF